jgi:hypothetical protein
MPFFRQRVELRLVDVHGFQTGVLALRYAASAAAGE